VTSQEVSSAIRQSSKAANLQQPRDSSALSKIMIPSTFQSDPKAGEPGAQIPMVVQGILTPSVNLDASIGAKKKKKTMIIVSRDDKQTMDRLLLSNEEAAAGYKELRDDDE
jgi:hypothetical protein